MKKRKFLYNFFVLGVSFFSIYVFFINFRVVFDDIDLFTIEKVRILGLKDYDPHTLIDELGLEGGTSLIFLDEDQIRRTISANRRLKLKSIRRDIPDTLEITVEEVSGPFLAFQGGKFYEYDLSGGLISSNGGIFDFDKIIITYPERGSIFGSNEAFQALLRAFIELPEEEQDLMSIISEIRIGEDYLLFPRNTRVAVNLGMDIDARRLRKARYAILYHQRKGLDYRYIDVRFDDLVRYAN